MSGKKLSDAIHMMTIEQVNALNDDFASLSQAIQALPKELDDVTQKKVNRLIDITQELEFHASKCRTSITASSNGDLSTIKGKLEDFLSKYENEHARSKADKSPSIFTTVMAGTIGGIIGSSLSIIVVFSLL